MGIFYSTEVRFDMCHFCLLCGDGRSSTSLMLSVGVSLMVPSMTLQHLSQNSKMFVVFHKK